MCGTSYKKLNLFNYLNDFFLYDLAEKKYNTIPDNFLIRINNDEKLSFLRNGIYIHKLKPICLKFVKQS